LDVAAEVFRQAGEAELEVLASERGWRDDVPAAVARVSGPGAALLAGERTALNFLGHLSGIATLTARFVKAVKGTGVKVFDTRKTTPGLRKLEKAAVAAGGGSNHRMGLYDAILIKENHAALAGGVGKAVRLAVASNPTMQVEVECRNPDEVREALDAGAGRLLLDNMSPAELRNAVATAAGGPRHRSSRPPAGSRSRMSPKSPPPGSTTSRSGHSPTRRPRSTSA
jgi:nicotinate-nucleotide pyrophosphorylase (carboxylating)